MKTNYHTHTLFCDGRTEAVTYVEEAIRQNLSALGFSAHAPVIFPTHWTLNPNRVKEYFDTINQLKEEFKKKIDIYCGLEADYFPDIFNETKQLYSGYPWDYIIGSIHFLGIRPDGQRWCIDGSNEEFREGWKVITDNDPFSPIGEYYQYTRQMIQEMKPDIIGHLDKIKIQYRPDCLIPESHPFYKEQVISTLEEIYSSGTIVEISTRGLSKGQTKELYPSKWVIEKMYQMNIPIMINSDAHNLGELTYGFEYASNILKNIGYKTVMTMKGHQWKEIQL